MKFEMCIFVVAHLLAGGWGWHPPRSKAAGLSDPETEVSVLQPLKVVNIF